MSSECALHPSARPVGHAGFALDIRGIRTGAHPIPWAGSRRRDWGSTWGIIRAIWKATTEDDCLDLAAQVSFYFSFSLFPFLLVMGALVGMLPSTTLWHNLAQWITDYLPRGSRHMVFLLILNLTQGSRTFLLIGLPTALWTASSGFVSLMESLTVTYGARDTRSYWKKRLIAIGATVVGAVFLVVSFGLLTFGHRIAQAISGHLESFTSLHVPWELGRWSVSLLLMVLGLDLMNRFLPNVRRRWCWITPGTIFVVLTMVASTIGFNFYLSHFGSYPRFYGTLAGFIILMTWIYLAILIVLVGAETDRVVEDQRKPRAAA